MAEKLLVVDSDARSLQAMDVGLRQAGFLVTMANDAQEAWNLALQRPPSLVVTETELSSDDGFELCRRLKSDERLRDVPILFVSRNKAIEGKIRGLDMGGAGYVTKPLMLGRLVAHIQKILELKRTLNTPQESHVPGGFSGALSDMSVPDLVQTFEVGRKSGSLKIRGNPSGVIFFADGRAIDAECGTRRAENAFYRLLWVREGQFEVQLGTQIPAKRIESATQTLLMEGMRRLDEWNRLTQLVPPLSSLIQVDSQVLADKLSVIPDDVSGLLRLVDGSRSLQEVVEASSDDALDVLLALKKLMDEQIIVLGKGPPLWENEPIFELPEVTSSELSTLEIPTADTATDPISAIEITLEEAEIESNPLDKAPKHLMEDWPAMEEVGLEKPTAPNPVSPQVYFEEAEAKVPVTEKQGRNFRVVSAAKPRRKTTTDLSLEDEFTTFARQQRIRKWMAALMVLSAVVLMIFVMNWLLEKTGELSTKPTPSTGNQPGALKNASPPEAPRNIQQSPVTGSESPSRLPPANPEVSLDVVIEKGQRARRAKAYAEAMALYRKALEAEPESTAAQMGLGISLSYTGQNFVEASQLLEKALSKDRLDAEGWYALGMAYQLSSREEKAWKAYETYLKLAPQGPFSEEVRALLETNGRKVK